MNLPFRSLSKKLGHHWLKLRVFLRGKKREAWERLDQSFDGTKGLEGRLAKAEGSYAKWRELEDRWQREERWKVVDRFVQSHPQFSEVFAEEDGLSSLLFRTLLIEQLSQNDYSGVRRSLTLLFDTATRVAKKEAREAFYSRAHQRLERVAPLKEMVSLFEVDSAVDSPGAVERAAFEKKELQAAIDRAEQLRGQIGATLEWLRRGLPSVPAFRGEEHGCSESRHTLYLTFGSLPFKVNGNASRTHGLLTAATSEGWKVRCVTRPGFPQEIPASLASRLDRLEGREAWEHSYRWEGVTYTNLRVKEAKQWRYDYQRQFDFWVDAAVTLAKRDRPILIHGASNFLIGSAAIHAAERLGLPSVYEMRGMWWLDFSSVNPEFAKTEEYERMAAFEVENARRAHHVFVISRGIKEFLLSKGIAEEKISFLPNGVNPERFKPGEPDPALLAKHGLTGEKVIGFVGTLAEYEGVETLLEAARVLADRGCRFKVLIIGDGPERSKLLERIQKLKLQDRALYLPPVPFNSVQDYMRMIDIIAIPRPGHAICERVTPIKPFEAMVMGKTVVGSSVGGIREIVQDGVTGLIHQKEDPISLAEKLELALGDHELRKTLGERAREWVLENHDWRQIIRHSITPVYERLAASKI